MHHSQVAKKKKSQSKNLKNTERKTIKMMIDFTSDTRKSRENEMAP